MFEDHVYDGCTYNIRLLTAKCDHERPHPESDGNCHIDYAALGQVTVSNLQSA